MQYGPETFWRQALLQTSNLQLSIFLHSHPQETKRHSHFLTIGRLKMGQWQAALVALACFSTLGVQPPRASLRWTVELMNRETLTQWTTALALYQFYPVLASSPDTLQRLLEACGGEGPSWVHAVQLYRRHAVPRLQHVTNPQQVGIGPWLPVAKAVVRCLHRAGKPRVAVRLETDLVRVRCARGLVGYSLMQHEGWESALSYLCDPLDVVILKQMQNSTKKDEPVWAAVQRVLQLAWEESV